MEFLKQYKYFLAMIVGLVLVLVNNDQPKCRPICRPNVIDEYAVPDALSRQQVQQKRLAELIKWFNNDLKSRGYVDSWYFLMPEDVAPLRTTYVAKGWRFDVVPPSQGSHVSHVRIY